MSSQRRSRRKGATYERDLVSRFKRVVGPRVRRGRQSGGGGAEEPDITGDDMPSWMHVEATHGAAPSVWAKMAQAERDDPSRSAVAVVRRDGGDEVVAMRWNTFEWMLSLTLRCLKTPECYGSNDSGGTLPPVTGGQ